MPHSFSLAASMNLEHSIKEGSHERYPVHLQCLRNIKKIKYPDFQAVTVRYHGIVYLTIHLGNSHLDLKYKEIPTKLYANAHLHCCNASSNLLQCTKLIRLGLQNDGNLRKSLEKFLNLYKMYQILLTQIFCPYLNKCLMEYHVH